MINEGNGSARHQAYKVNKKIEINLQKALKCRMYSTIYRSTQNIPKKGKKKEAKLAAKDTQPDNNSSVPGHNKLRCRSSTPLQSKSVQKIKKIGIKSNRLDLIALDIVKSKSDLLEIKRDLAAYELNLILGKNISQKLEKLKNIGLSVSTSFAEFNLENTDRNLLLKINSVFSAEAKKTANGGLENAQAEKFKISTVKYNSKNTSFQGFVQFSGIRFLCKVYSKSISYHVIQYLIEDKSGKMTVEKSLHGLELLSYSKNLNENIFPFCYAFIFKDETGLIFDPFHSVDFITRSIKVKGLGFAVLKISFKDRDLELEIVKYRFQVDVSEERLSDEGISLDALREFDQAEIKKLEKYLAEFLFFYKKQLLLLDKENIFSLKERNSFLIKDEKLSSIFSKFRTDKIDFFLRINGKQVNVSIYDENSIKISIKNFKKFRIDLSDIYFLTDLQYLTIKQNPVTLSKSLELKFFIIRLFKI